MNEPRDDRPRLGPWLSSYGRREQRSLRDRATELALVTAAGLVFLVLSVGILWLFVRYPFPVFGGLAAIWVVGFLVLLVVNRRARTRERQLHDGSLFDQIRSARRKRR